MKKTCKIVIMFLIVFLFFSNVCKINASGINMNLSNSTDQTTYGSNSSDSEASSRNNNSQQSSIVVSNANDNVSEGLTISDMINIILCAIGIILILLGIAILIKQRS